MPVALSPEQQPVITHRGGPLQVIACAGSGKTESISQRVASLIADGAPPESIIAFTFTEKAASELKERIHRRVADLKGEEFLGRLAPMFIGTIHGYCFRLLQDYAPKYADFDVLDEHRHQGFLSREYSAIGLVNLGPKHWQPVRDFARMADVIANELIDPQTIAGTPLGDCYSRYVELLESFRFLTFGLLVSRAVAALKDEKVLTRVRAPLRHLIVDEYQDINPAQEELIRLLGAAPAELCVVGDDDQSIYQWRGSEIENILQFAPRRPGTATFRLETNRRSRPTIIKTANNFASSIPKRLPKSMKPDRPAGSAEVVCWSAPTPLDESERLAETITALKAKGFSYKDIAILFRSVKTSAPALTEVLDRHGIPYQCGGRTGLFLQPEMNVLGEFYCWFVDGSWKDARFDKPRPASLDNVVAELSRLHGHGDEEFPGLRRYLEDWRTYRLDRRQRTSLVDDFYLLLRFLGVHNLNPDDPIAAARLGAYARFSRILADFEHVTRRGHYVDQDGTRTFRPGQDHGKYFFQRLANYILHYARDAYEDFEGEVAHDLDAVSILTVHQAKGLEWPVVFLPALTSRRFPSVKAGREQSWLFEEAVFPRNKRDRYEGGDAEERRLFYVAMTRARDALYMSHFERQTNAAHPSPYLVEVAGGLKNIRPEVVLPLPEKPTDTKATDPPPLNISFSDVAQYDECGYRYRLARNFEFQLALALELGYGKAIHHVLRQLAERVRDTGKIPSRDEADALVDSEFYVPFADRSALKRMHDAARSIVRGYLDKYASDLHRVWAVERPFQVRLEEGIISGKADVILDGEGQPGRLAIVDYKAAEDESRDERYALQLAIYAAAGRAEGLTVEAAYLHPLKGGERKAVDVSEPTANAAVARLAESVKGIRRGEFPACPDRTRCGACDFKKICAHSKAPEE